MQKPKADIYVEFERGGVAISKTPQQAYLTFYTKLNRIVTEVPVPYYLFSQTNVKEIDRMIKSSWSQATQFAPEKALSPPSDIIITDIVFAIKELLDIK